MGEIRVTTRKQVMLAEMLVTMLESASAFGEDRAPCHEAYPQSGLTHKQMSFEQFREMYSDSACASSHLEATHKRPALGKEVDAM